MCSITRMMKTSFCLNYHKRFAILLKKIYHVLVKRHTVPTAFHFLYYIRFQLINLHWTLNKYSHVIFIFFLKSKYGYWYFYQYCSYELLSSIIYLILTKNISTQSYIRIIPAFGYFLSLKVWKINGRWCTIKFKTRSVKYWQNRLNLTLSLTLITIKYNNNLSRWYIIWRKIS